jgi:predicted HicB family RNase H-like nuclease
MNRKQDRMHPVWMQLRLPHELKAWIEQEAARNGASQNSEIIRAIRTKMDAAEQSKKAG